MSEEDNEKEYGEANPRVAFITPAPEIDIDNNWRWVVLICGFVLNAMSLGLAFSVGVFYTEWLHTFKESKSITAWICSANIAVLFGSGPFISVFINRFSPRSSVLVGCFLATIGIFSGAFATSVLMLYLTYGVLTGLGMGFIYLTSIGVVGDYFPNKHRRFALGCTVAGTGFGSLAFPPALNLLINYYGWRGALMITAGIFSQSFICGALLRPVGHKTLSVKQTDNTSKKRKISSLFDTSILKETQFYIFAISLLFWHIGSVIHIVLLPAFAQRKGISVFDSTWLLSVLGISNTVTRFIAAGVAHRVYFNIMGGYISTIILSGLLMCLYPLYHTFWWFLLTSLIYGFAYGIFVGLLAIVVSELFGPKRLTSAFGYLLLWCGTGSLVGPPFAGWLFDLTGSYDIPFYVAGTFNMLSGVLLFSIPMWKKSWTTFYVEKLSETEARKEEL